MWRWVIRDYFVAFRWGKIKDWLKSGDWFWVFYFWVLLPNMIGFNEKAEYIVLYYILSMPVGYCLISEALHENLLPKMFYLCPMEKEQRKAYVERKFIFAMIVPAILGGIFAVIIWAFSHCHPLTAIMYWVNVVILGILTSSFLGKRKVKIPKEGSNQSETVNTTSGAVVGNLIVTLFSIYGMGMMLCNEVSIESWCVWVFVSVAIFVQLPLLIKHLSGWNKAMENAVGYAKTRL